MFGTSHRVHALIALAVSLAFVGGCVPARDAPSAAGAPTEVFYPPPPAAPRVQHLMTLSGEHDLGERPSDFATFVLGDDTGGTALAQPYGVAYHDGRIYVADAKLRGLAVFDLTTRRMRVVTGSGPGRMRKPINVTIATDGTKYVTDTGRNQILVLDREDRFVTAFGDEGQFKPVDVAIAGDRLYVTDIDHHRVVILDRTSGRAVGTFGKAGSGPGELFHPTNIAVGPDGDVYVTETSNFRVQRFRPDGASVRVYGVAGDTPGSFARPKGLAVDAAGRIYVSDTAFQNVQVFRNDGKLLMSFGQSEDAPTTALNLPAAVDISYEAVSWLGRLARPDFELEYVILVASQFGPNKVDLFGFGKLQGASYPAESASDRPSVAAATVARR